MLTHQSQYAIRAILYLAINSSVTHKMSSKDIAEKIDIPAPFLAKIFQLLSKAKLIRSVKGPHGGFYMTETERKNNLMDVIACIDGTQKLYGCFLGLPRCSDENPCAVHHIVAPFKEKMISELTNKDISVFADETKKGKSFIFLK